MTNQTKMTAAAAVIVASMTVSTGAAEDSNPLDNLGYVVQFVRFESSLPRDELLAAANERRPLFEAMPGLIQKYYLDLNEPNSYGGFYVWESKEAMAAFRETDTFKGIAVAYGVASQPQVDIFSLIFPLR